MYHFLFLLILIITLAQQIAELVLSDEAEQGGGDSEDHISALPGSHAWPDRGFREQFRQHWANLHFPEGEYCSVLCVSCDCVSVCCCQARSAVLLCIL